MSLVLIATSGAVDANSYPTLAEAQTYWESRLFTGIWDDSDDQTAALVWATRTLDALLSPRRYYVPGVDGAPGVYRTRPTWTGAVATQTQALAWPRFNMLNRNGVAILSTVIPRELKEATAELAGWMSQADRTADNDVAVQGITDLKAGPVSLSFRKFLDTSKVLPDSVLDLLVPSWLTNEVVSGAFSAEFDVVSE